MRRRPIQVIVYLNEEEHRHLCELCKKTKLPKTTLIRYLIYGCVPIEAPPADYPKLIRELRAVGNNLNQLVRFARINGYINTPELNKILDDLRKTEHEVNMTFTVKQGK